MAQDRQVRARLTGGSSTDDRHEKTNERPSNLLTEPTKTLSVVSVSDQHLQSRDQALAPMPSDRRCRTTVAWWPIEWRQRWADLAEGRQAAGDQWDRAEWIAFLAVEDAIANAEALGEDIPIVEPRAVLSEANARAQITAMDWSGGSLADLIEAGRQWNADVRRKREPRATQPTL